MDRTRFLADGAALGGYLGSKSPTYARALEGLLRSVEGEARWFVRLCAAWEGRSFTTDYEAPSLLLHSVHWAALTGAAPKLRLSFPSCEGAWGPESNQALIEFLEGAPPSFWEDLRERRLQTNDPARSAGWMLVACAFFRARSLPFHLVDLGTSAGLTLVGDYLPRYFRIANSAGNGPLDPPGWRDAPMAVLSRTGFDAHPVDLMDNDQLTWLRACLGPDNPDGTSRFDEAASLFLRLRRQPDFMTLIKGELPEAPNVLAGRIRPHPEEGLLLFNSQAGDFLTDRDYARLEAGARTLLSAWGERGVWVQFEMPRDRNSRRHELSVSRLVRGAFEARVLACLTGRPMEIASKAGWEFLRSDEASMGPRITREEPIKILEPGTYRFPKGEQ